MKKISRKIRQYLPFSRAGVQSFLVYKAQTFMWLFISFFELFFIVFLYQAIYKNSDNGLNSVINGFSFYEIILYMITSFVFSYIVSSTDTSWNIFTDIQEGTIANTLTKPVSYRLKHLFTYIGLLAIGYVVIVIPILSIVYGIFLISGLIKIQVGRFIINVILFMLFTVLACLINDALSYLIGLLTFFTEHMFGLNLFKSAIQNLLSGALIPLSYMGSLGLAFAYTPFAFLNSTPILTLMGKVELLQALIYIGVGILWVCALEIFNHYFFRFCVKRVSVQGG